MSRGRIIQLARLLRSGLANLEGPESAFEVIESYERLSGEVYRLRAGKTGEAGLREAEELLSETAGDLFRVAQPVAKKESAYRDFIIEYRKLWRKHIELFLFTTAIFVGCCVLGWNIGLNEPDYVNLIAGQRMMETIYDHKAWFETIQGNSTIEGALIAWNNIKVSIMAFTLGGLFGIGGLWILAYNGLLFGCILGYCYKNGFQKPLIGFVVSHGPLELTIIIASCFAGLLIGRAFFVWPPSLIRARLAIAAKEAATVCVGVVPWLLLAGTIEGFISPYQILPFEMKVALGLLMAAMFWLWTFGPIPHAKRDARKSP